MRTFVGTSDFDNVIFGKMIPPSTIVKYRVLMNSRSVQFCDVVFGSPLMVSPLFTGSPRVLYISLYKWSGHFTDTRMSSIFRDEIIPKVLSRSPTMCAHIWPEDKSNQRKDAAKTFRDFLQWPHYEVLNKWNFEGVISNLPICLWYALCKCTVGSKTHLCICYYCRCTLHTVQCTVQRLLFIVGIYIKIYSA